MCIRDSSEELRFTSQDRQQVYGWVEQVLVQQEYTQQDVYKRQVLENMLRQFPFRIRGFHTDNGSEFINRTVAELLEKLLIEQTKSRPRQSGDNGLVETKNCLLYTSRCV